MVSLFPVRRNLTFREDRRNARLLLTCRLNRVQLVGLPPIQFDTDTDIRIIFTDVSLASPVWSGNITLGKQNFRIDFDTGSSVSVYVQASPLAFADVQCHCCHSRSCRISGCPPSTVLPPHAKAKYDITRSYPANLFITQARHSLSTMSMGLEYQVAFTQMSVSLNNVPFFHLLYNEH